MTSSISARKPTSEGVRPGGRGSAILFWCFWYVALMCCSVIFQNRQMYFHFVASILTRLPRVAVVNSTLNSQSKTLQSQIQPSSWHHIFHLHARHQVISDPAACLPTNHVTLLLPRYMPPSWPASSPAATSSWASRSPGGLVQ